MYQKRKSKETVTRIIVEHHLQISVTNLASELLREQLPMKSVGQLSSGHLAKLMEEELSSEIVLMKNWQLQKILTSCPKNKYYVVLTIPSFPNWFEGMMQVIQECTGALSPSDKLSNEIGAHSSKQVLEKIREMDDHVKRNGNYLKHPTEFIVIPDATKSKNFHSVYSIYKGGKLFKDNLNCLPRPPTCLSAKQSKSNMTISLNWEFEDPGYPYTFLILYRPKTEFCNCSWKRQEGVTTLDTKIYLVPGSVMEVLIATETCIGSSKYIEFQTKRLPHVIIEIPRKNPLIPNHWSAIVKETAAGPSTTSSQNSTSFLPPTFLEVESVTDCMAELLWSLPVDDEKFKFSSYKVLYRRFKKGAVQQSLNVASTSIGCRLENLQAGMTYIVDIIPVSDDGQESSSSSELLFTTTKCKVVRFAEKMMNRCERIKFENGLDVYAVPLTKSPDSGMTQHFSFGEAAQSKQHKTIIITGVDTDLKSKLINGMINYIFGVNWLDSFRFQLISKEMDETLTDPRYKMYHIHHTEGFRIPYSLTIIDSPDRVDIPKLNEYPQAFRFILCRDIDADLAVFFVDSPVPSQVYLFDSIVSVYSENPKGTRSRSELSTEKRFVETGTPARHKFDTSVFFCWNRKMEQVSKTDGGGASRRYHFSSNYREYKLNRFMWSMNMKKFEYLFSV